MMIALLSFLTMFLMIYLVMSTYLPGYGTIEMRLRALDHMASGRTDIDDELAKPFRQRVLSPLTGGLAASLMRFTPKSIRKMVEHKMEAAGGFGGIGPDEFLLLCGFMGVSFPVVVSFLLKLASFPSKKIVGYAMIAFALGLFIPFLLLSRKIEARKLSIQRALPDVLDLLTVSVEAGLGFDGALARLSEKMKGALVDEFARVLQEIRMGSPRREALHALGTRCNVADLSLFTTSLVQADQLGVSIGNVLRVQSASMREKRRQRAEEKAMKAPVKMLLPMVMFIFPTIFIVLLGPAMLQILSAFANK